MFNKIDNTLIVWAQWTVRQFELYTPIERKHLIGFFISVLRCTLIVWAVISVIMAVLIISPDIFIVGAVGIFTNYGYFLSYKKLANKEPSKDVLPEEIISRYIFRMAYCLISISSLLLLPLMYLLCISPQGDILLFTMFVMVFFANFCFYFFNFLEYLFCTISLPPGEKQKRREEKETRNMISILN